MSKALLLYNPAAGRFPIRPFIPSVRQLLSERGWETEVIETRSGDHAVESAKEAAARGIEVVFAAGGDGTVGQVAGALMGSDTALGVLPAGTSNVWGREVGLQPFSLARWKSLQENLRILLDSPVESVDMGVCNGHPFFMWAGLGLDALTVGHLEPRMRFEKFFNVPEYAASTILNAAHWRGLSLRIWADDEPIEQDSRCLLAVVNNIRHYLGGLATLSPNAYLDDGVFDLWLFFGDSLSDAFRHAFDLWRGEHVSSENVRQVSFRSLRIETDSPYLVQMDGEPVLETKEAHILVHRKSLKILLPPRARQLLSPPAKGSLQ